MKNDNAIIAAGIMLAAIGIFSSLKTAAKASAPVVTPLSLDDLYHKHGTFKGLDWRIIKAIAIIESNENPQAINPTDPSYGLMQVLCTATAMTQQCTNRFPSVPRWSEATRERLLTDPDFNVHVGSTILKWNIDTYGMPKGIAVYNSWSARHDPANGPFRNQGYVDKYQRAFNSLS